MESYLDRIYVPNYQNKVPPIDRKELTLNMTGLTVEEVALMAFNALDLASATMNNDAGCEHRVNYLLNQLVIFTFGARELLRRGERLHVTTDYDYYLGMQDFELWDPEQILVHSSTTISMYVEELQTEIVVLPNEFSIYY